MYTKQGPTIRVNGIAGPCFFGYFGRRFDKICALSVV